MNTCRLLLLGVALLGWPAVGWAGQPNAPGGDDAPVPSVTATEQAPARTGAPSESATASAPTAPRPSPAPQPVLDRSTPRQTVTGFLRAVDDSRIVHAVQYLDLRGMRWNRQTPEQATRQLAEVLQHRLGIDVSRVADVPEGDPIDGADVERLGTVALADRRIPITLERVRIGGNFEWLFSRTTVAVIPELSDAVRPDHWLVPLLPDSVSRGEIGPLWTWQWLGLLLAILVGFPAGRLAARVVLSVLTRLAKRTPTSWDDAVVLHVQRPVRFAFGWLAGGLVALSLGLPATAGRVVHLIATMPLILAVGWALMAAMHGFTAAYLLDLPDDREMNTRGLRTQVVLLRKLANVAIGLVTIGVVLMQFEVVRDVGVSLLASAGVAGVAIGIAAQKSLGAVIAGLQISITQPIRLGDAITFQGQWGEVEEIALTYVRVKLWDERRLVVPVEKFLTEPFENWSKPGTEMIGVVEIAVDPTTPMELVRAELHRLAEEHPVHDGRKCVVQVTDVNESRALVRALVSVSEVGAIFAMRCQLREGIMVFLQELEGGRYLPRQRWQALDGSTEPTGPAAP